MSTAHAPLRSSRPARFAFAAALLGLLLSSAGWAAPRPTVTVADFSDATGRNRGDKARAAILRALEEENQVDLVPFSRVREAATGLHIRARDLAKRENVCRAAAEAGAESVVTGSIFRAGSQTKLTVAIHDRVAHELWSKEIVLSGEVTPQLARKFAAALAAAAGARAAQAAAALPPPPAPTLASGAPRRIEASPRDDEPRHGDEGALASAPPQKRRSSRDPGRDETEEDLATAGGDEGASASVGFGPSLLQLSASFSTTWRSYRFCPEVENCEQTSPANAGAPVKYTTDKPYGGFLIGLDLFPMHERSDALQGLGVSAAFGRSMFLVTNYKDQDGTAKQFGSTQQRLSFEAVYRYYFHLDSAGTGWLGGRAGWMSHAFLVDENPKIVESRRSGVYASVDVGVPLHRFLRIEAKGSLVPWASPGDAEKKVYGAAASGGGYTASAGLATDFGHPEWHFGLAAMFDYIHFGDRYANYPDTHPTFGRGLEDYTGFSVAGRTHY